MIGLRFSSRGASMRIVDRCGMEGKAHEIPVHSDQ